ncbi:MAG: type II secretion system F family protein [Rhodocyclaceae bacterium]|jgi:type IV pilus assembly protein PilC|nr:type II secretion system F family protein [Rhodocyclaceae bacterium]MCE2980372.1 type II secretion system F family protein [Betaproteobacteria bacterium]MCA3075539.1 type II secretion system F family protein [Rhodocyclaceae bacterium]MCA3092107.1 type II secretion system F family protein [Rhodocyclaceae bacterium]MCA3095936.1 type II secretion system F family protein [Rhodocyclaceae bacterium]
MATTITQGRKKDVQDYLYTWVGQDRTGKAVRGEMRANGENVVIAQLRRQGLSFIKVKRQRVGRGRKITEKDIAIFTRQLAVMMKAGVPLLQAFDIVGKGHSNAAVQKVLMTIKVNVETGSSLSQAFRGFPEQFDDLFCNLVAAGEQAGILDTLLDRLATYKEKIIAIKGKIKSALFYPISIVVVAFIITAIIMIFVIPSFKQVFASFGADLPAPTLIVMAISDFFVAYWWAIFGAVGGAIYLFIGAYKKSETMRNGMDRLILKTPVFGEIVQKASIARWSRTLATMFAAGVPLVEALGSVAGAAGNAVYMKATKRIQQEISTGTSLTVSMQGSDVFPNMVLQMVAIGEESGALDGMLSKVADFYEAEVDDAVDAMSSLMEPVIMVVLGTLIGGMVISMYLPIFKMGQVV